jgi:hypothetical protein
MPSNADVARCCVHPTAEEHHPMLRETLSMEMIPSTPRKKDSATTLYLMLEVKYFSPRLRTRKKYVRSLFLLNFVLNVKYFSPRLRTRKKYVQSLFLLNFVLNVLLKEMR